MNSIFETGRLYRMPAHFGPMAGPRQGPDGAPFDWSETPHKRMVALSFLTDAKVLAALLPPQLEPVGPPLVTIEISYLSRLEWLAGRGYNTFGVRWPARFRGERDEIVGSFLSILWENLADPILSGRDELGFSKLYCEIPEPRIFRGRESYEASWLGHRFFELEFEGAAAASAEEMAEAQRGMRNDGLLHSRYVPRVGGTGGAAVGEITLTPATGSKAVIDQVWRGKGAHRFHQSRWEDLPTMFQIVNALAGLPVLEYRDTWLTHSHGGKDLSDQRVLT